MHPPLQLELPFYVINSQHPYNSESTQDIVLVAADAAEQTQQPQPLSKNTIPKASTI